MQGRKQATSVMSYKRSVRGDALRKLNVVAGMVRKSSFETASLVEQDVGEVG